MAHMVKMGKPLSDYRWQDILGKYPGLLLEITSRLMQNTADSSKRKEMTAMEDTKRQKMAESGQAVPDA